MQDINTPKESIYTRTEMLLGADAISAIKASRVALFGVGGVGGYCAEALARAGVGEITLVDSDTVSITNLNRQIIATRDTVGRYKTEVMRERILSINPDCRVTVKSIFYSEETSGEFDLSEYDYIADCIDSVKAKLHLIKSATQANVKIISSMGAGNKLDPTRFTVTDISKTHTDPLARVIRTELKKCGIYHLKVVFSDEKPIEHEGGRLPGSVSFVPGAAGLAMAGEIVRELALERQMMLPF